MFKQLLDKVAQVGKIKDVVLDFIEANPGLMSAEIVQALSAESDAESVGGALMDLERSNWVFRDNQGKYEINPAGGTVQPQVATDKDFLV